MSQVAFTAPFVVLEIPSETLAEKVSEVPVFAMETGL
jgi:hypothetical protein